MIIFGVVLLNACVMGIAHGLDKYYRLKYKKGYKLECAVIIGVCSLISVIFYIGILCLLNSAVNKLKRFAEERSSGSDKLTAGLHFTMIIVLFLSTLTNDSLQTIAFFGKAFGDGDSWWNLSSGLANELVTVGQIVKIGGTFVAFIILLFMFWKYTLIQELIDGAPSIPTKTITKSKLSIID